MALQMNAKDTVTIEIATNVNLTGYTCQLVIKDAQGNRSVVSCTPASDGSYASYTTTATDFPAPGTYTCQLLITQGQTSLSGSPFQIQVGERI